MTTAEHHFDRDAAERYVTGAAGEEEALGLEAHAARCAACADLLATEARLEEQLHALAARPGAQTASAAGELPASTRPRPARRRARWAVRLAMAGALAGGAAAALVALSVQGYPEPPLLPAGSASAPAPAVICFGDLAGCAQAAHARGLLVQYPALGDVPRYEAGASIPPESSGARAPFPL